MLDTLTIVKTPKAARRLFPAALWKVKTREKILYLTFDDGPIAEVTPLVLDELQRYGAKATFFCIGKNIEANTEIFHRISEEGHMVGNHTYDHLNGWQSANQPYFESVEKCAAALAGAAKPSVSGDYRDMMVEEKNYFRPPYGKLNLSQYNHLKKSFTVVMWDVLAFDFDLKVTKEQVLDNVVKNAVPGSIIVFHDSLKAKDKMLFALPKVLEHYTNLGYTFETLPE
jgi:peptidoglycan/xylan/chitin deacetylase (PgdA/CDA1 family)